MPATSPKLPSSTTHKAASLAESEAAFDVLPEVLQAQARVDDPGAAARKQYELRAFKGEPPPMTANELRRHRVRSLAVHHVPKLSLGGRNRYVIPTNPTSIEPAALTPHATEVASRSFTAGLRAMAYGSLLGLLGTALAGTFIARSFAADDSQDGYRTRVRDAAVQAGDAVRRWLEPYKLRLRESISSESSR